MRTESNAESSVTEAVVRNHLQAFLEQQGIAAILDDYDENARFYSEAKIYRGRQEIRGFFVDFIGSLPAGAVDHFSLRSRRVDGNIAYITWSAGSDIPLGTDTSVVENGKIVFADVRHVCRAGSVVPMPRCADGRARGHRPDPLSGDGRGARVWRTARPINPYLR
jgi:hypothetical protein